jgi:DUF4097 and DUF4098 domain-containing protein YvlB
MNKTKVISTLIISTILCFVFARLLATAIPENGYSFPKNVFYEYAKITNVELEKTRLTFNEKNITSIDIKSLSSNITVEESLSDDIEVLIAGGEESLVSSVEGEALLFKIQDTKKGKFYINMGTRDDFYFSISDSKVIVKIPTRLKELKIKSTSGDVRLRNINTKSVLIKLISGDITYKATNVGDINLETVSGDIKVESKAGPQNVLCKTISGDVHISSTSLGLLNVYLKNVSGETIVSQFTEEFILGDEGKFIWKIETVSGDIKI